MFQIYFFPLEEMGLHSLQTAACGIPLSCQQWRHGTDCLECAPQTTGRSRNIRQSPLDYIYRLWFALSERGVSSPLGKYLPQSNTFLICIYFKWTLYRTFNDLSKALQIEASVISTQVRLRIGRDCHFCLVIGNSSYIWLIFFLHYEVT